MNHRKIGHFLPLFLLTLILGACSNRLPAADSASPAPVILQSPTETTPAADSASPAPIILQSPTETTPATQIVSDAPTLPIPQIEVTVATPYIDQSSSGNVTEIAPTASSCGYQWAYQNLPELSGEFQQAMEVLQPNVQTRVFAFGEDCVYADGRKTFLPMETDFDITLQVNDPTNADELGSWVVKVMQIILNIPKDQIMGLRPGRVSIVFQVGNQNQGINFYLDKYLALPPGLSNIEIYQKLKTP